MKLQLEAMLAQMHLLQKQKPLHQRQQEPPLQTHVLTQKTVEAHSRVYTLDNHEEDVSHPTSLVDHSYVSPSGIPHMHQESHSSAISDVKFLTSQIPYFNGIEKDNIDIWIDRIESVAEMYNLSHKVMLCAAITRLGKTARRWFDLNSGSIFRSWIEFRSAIIDRFKRRVFFSNIMQKAEARKWLPSRATFSDYAMEKLAIIQPLKLTDQDSIQLLINGIQNLAIGTSALSLKHQH